MSSKQKLKSFYIRFYKTGEFRKIEAVDEESARQIAEQKFGNSSGVYTLGTLLKVGNKIPNTGILLKR